MSKVEELWKYACSLDGYIGKAFMPLPNPKGKSYNADMILAAIGLENLGYEVIYVELPGKWEDRCDYIKSLGITAETPCVGDLHFVHQCIRTIKPDFKALPTYPDELKFGNFEDDFWNRKIWRFQVKEVFDQPFPCFMKPAITKQHGFSGAVVNSIGELDITPVSLMDEDEWMYGSEIMEMHNEWRIFVMDGEPLDARLYLQRTDHAWCASPQYHIVTEIRHRLAEFGWHNYCIDVNVGSSGRVTETKLIEITDGYCFGAYGCNELVQAKILINRWKEITK